MDPKPNFNQNTNEKESLQFKEDVNSLVSDIKSYEKDNSMGAIMAEGLLEKHGEKIDRMSVENFYQRNNFKLKNLGLTIESSDLKNLQLFIKGGSEDDKRPTQLYFNIEDYLKFNSNLEKLTPESIDQNTADSLRDIFKSLEDQVKNTYDLSSPTEDRLFNLFNGLEQTISNCKRLDPNHNNGLHESANSLEIILNTSRKGYMKEYIFAEKHYVIPNTIAYERFGPLKWLAQVETNPIKYKERWKEYVFDTFDNLKNNSNANELYKLIKDNLVKEIPLIKLDLDKTIQRFEIESKESGIKETQLKNLLEIKNNVIQDIELQLTNY